MREKVYVNPIPKKGHMKKKKKKKGERREEEQTEGSLDNTNTELPLDK